MLGGKEEQPFDRFNFLFGKSNGVLEYWKRFSRASQEKSVHLVTMCQMENKKTKTKTKLFFPFPLSDNISRKIYQTAKVTFLEVQFFYIFLFCHLFPSVLPSVRPGVRPPVRPSVRPSVHPSIHPRTHLQSIVSIPNNQQRF